MKSILFRATMLLCVTIAAVVMAGCDTTDVDSKQPSQPDIVEVTFDVVELKHDEVVVTVTPPSDDTLYYAFLYPDTEEFKETDHEIIYVDIRYAENFEDFLVVGTQTLTFQGLIGHSYYRVVYFEYDEQLDRKVGDLIFSDCISTPDAPEEIDIEVSNIKGMSATITVTPPTEDLRYFCWVYTMDSYERYQHCSDYELLAYDYSYWVYASQMYGIDLEQMIEFDTLVGTQTFSTDDLLFVAEWDTEYLVWAYGVTTEGVVTTTITRRTFKTVAPKPSTMTFNVPNVDVEWYEEETPEGLLRGWRANATIIPSNKQERYFATITNKSWYDWYFTEDNDGRSDDDYIINQILCNAQKPSSELPMMFKSGDIEFDCYTEREILLKPAREYAVFVFGVDDNGATTKLSVFPFTTDVMPQ